MKPIKFLDQDIASKIHQATTKFFDMNPISIISTLNTIFQTHQEHLYFDDNTAQTVRDIMTNNPEQLLLHFATYNVEREYYADFITPISDKINCITSIRKTQGVTPTAVTSYLQKDGSDIQFDLTLVDTYDLDIEKSKTPHVKTYLYGNPYEDDWQHVEETNFCSIDDVIKNNK